MTSKKTSEKENASTNELQGTSKEIWEEIKGKNLELFALPNQKVEAHCTPLNVDQNRLFLTISASSVLPALERAIGSAYSVELADKYVIVTRSTN